MATGKQLLVLSDHPTGVSSAIFNPDGTRILTVASGGKLIKLWDAVSGKELHSFEANLPFGKILKRQAFSPDGRRLVLPGPSSITRVWDTENGKLVLTLDAREGLVRTALYSLDGKQIITTDDIGRIWDADSGALLGKLEGHTSLVVDGEFSPKGDVIVTASWDNTAKVWGRDFRARFTLGGHRPNLQSVAFAADGSRIVTRDAMGVKVWEAATGRLLIEFDTTQGMAAPALSPSGEVIASPVPNNSVTVMRIPVNGWISRLEPGQGMVNAISCSADGRRVAVGAAEGFSLWGVGESRRSVIAEAPHERITAIEFNSGGTRFLTVGAHQSFSVRDVGTGRAVATLSEQMDGHSSGVLRASLHPDGRRVVVAGVGRNAIVWDVEANARVLSLPHVSHGVTLAQFSPHGDQILTAELRKLHMWETSTGHVLSSTDSHGGFVDAVSFSRDGSLLATVDDQGAVKLWQADGLRFLRPLEDGGKGAQSVAFSPDNAFVLTTNLDGSAKFWDTATGALLFSLEAGAPGDNPKKPASVRSALFIPDGERIIVAIDDIAEIWDARGETRSPAEAIAFVRCRAPWEIRRGELVEARPDPAACLKVAAGR